MHASKELPSPTRPIPLANAQQEPPSTGTKSCQPPMNETCAKFLPLNGTCLCYPGFFSPENSTDCFKCAPSCSSCRGSADFCTSCSPFGELNATSGQCTCTNSSYADETLGMCLPCLPTCDGCTDANNCLVVSQLLRESTTPAPALRIVPGLACRKCAAMKPACLALSFAVDACETCPFGNHQEGNNES